MKYTQLAAFQKHLQGGVERFPPPLYLILSKEDFPRRKALEILLKIYAQQLGVAVKTLEGDTPALFEEIGTLSLFSKRSLLVLNSIDKWLKPTQKRVESYLNSPDSRQMLVLTGSSLSKSSALYKRCETIGVIFDAAEEKPWEKEKSLASWLGQAAHGYGKQIEPAACQQLVKQLGVDQTLLDQELQKLVCYVGEKGRIELNDVIQICGTLPTQTVFQLADALIKGEIAQAWPIAAQLLSDSQQLLPLLRALRSQWKNGWTMTTFSESGAAADQLQHHLPNMSPALIHRQLQQFLPYGSRRFKLGLLAIDAAESLAKNSAGTELQIMERLIFNLIPQRL